MTLTSTTGNATDLGFVLFKHPDKVQKFDLGWGEATVCYPQVSPERCTVALLVDIDPIALARRKRGTPESFALGRYVNDRPYAASSMLASAIKKVFATAMTGRCDSRLEAAAQPMNLQITIPALPARSGAGATGGAALVRALFEPLGWQVEATVPPLAEGFSWGDSPYVMVTLTGRMRVQDALNHLFILLPVLDNAKHYFITSDDVDKLIRRGEGWLAGHPSREMIMRRYLSRRPLIDDAMSRLAALDDALIDDDAAEASADLSTLSTEAGASASTPPTLSLQQIRRDAVLAVLAESRARTVADIGCGEGYYLRSILPDPRYTDVLGIDVSATELSRAESRLNLDRLPDQVRSKLTLRQSSVTYRDDTLNAYDAVLLVEVIEHVELDRLDSLERNIFAAAHPTTVIVTTPNIEYNVRYPALHGGLRHRDHRFEWSRAEFAAWALHVAQTYGYQVQHRPIGEDDAEVGAPTQLAWFTRKEA